MNRFFRTAYATTAAYLCLALAGVLITGAALPFPAFSCLYFGLLLFLLPGISQRMTGKEKLFQGLGVLTAALGFLPIALWRCPTVHWLVHLLGIAAAAVFLSVLRHRTTHKVFLAKFGFASALLFLLVGLVYLILRTDIVQGGEASARYEAASLAVNGAVPYAVVLLASGVLLLRGLRAQPGRMVDEQAFNRRQLRDTLIFAALVTVVFAIDPFAYLGKALSFLHQEALRPFLRFLAQLFASLLPSMSFDRQPAKGPALAGEGVNSGAVPPSGPAGMETEYNRAIKEIDPAVTVDHLLLAVLALVFLFVLLWLIRKLAKNLRSRSRDRGNGYPRETYEALPAKEGKRRKEKPKKRNGDPRELMRYLYGEFLRFLRKRQVEFDKTNTCGEIRRGAEKQSAADPSMLSDLTALYEQARYRMEETPAEADAHAMKDLLDRIKKRP